MDAGAADHLRADCSRCAALCCIVPAFTRSAQFAITKAAGVPCPNLVGTRCGVHDRLRETGFSGCAAYDCFGAGQRVTEHVVAGRDLRTDPVALAEVREVFGGARRWHEVAWHLDVASRLPGAEPLRAALAEARDAALAAALAPVAGRHGSGGAATGRTGPPEAADLDAQRDQMDELLRRASALARAGWPDARDLRGASLIGADLQRADLRGANLRGAVLLGADLAGARLTGADVTGADLRGARLAGADLWGVLFCTQAQLDVASGDRMTRLPLGVQRPHHWSSADPA